MRRSSVVSLPPQLVFPARTVETKGGRLQKNFFAFTGEIERGEERRRKCEREEEIKRRRRR